jgi:hypothetical protein
MGQLLKEKHDRERVKYHDVELPLLGGITIKITEVFLDFFQPAHIVHFPVSYSVWNVIGAERKQFRFILFPSRLI